MLLSRSIHEIQKGTNGTVTIVYVTIDWGVVIRYHFKKPLVGLSNVSPEHQICFTVK